MACIGLALCNFKSCKKGLPCEMERIKNLKYEKVEFEELGYKELIEISENEIAGLKENKKWKALKRIAFSIQ